MGRAFLPADAGGFVLSVPDGVSFGVMPPAAYFSRGRKVGKSPLRTKVLRTPFDPIMGSLVPFVSLPLCG